VHAGSIGFKGTHINNHVSATTGDINLANNQTTGVLNIGTGSRTGDGAINIGTAGTGAFNINIGTASQSPTPVNNVLVGSNGCIAGRTVYLSYSATATIPATTNLDLFVLYFGSTASQTLTLSTFSVTQRMYIKNYASVDVTIKGGVMLLYAATAPSSSLLLKSGESTLLFYNSTGWIQISPTNAFGTLDAPEVDTAMSLGSNLTTGNLTIAGAQTDGDINIGTGSARLAGGAINIGTGTTAINPITIGGTASIVEIGNIIESNVYNSKGSGTANNMEIGKNLTTGNIVLGEFQTSGNINIGTGTARVLGGQGSEINIGTGSTVANPIKIGSSTSVITLGAQPTIGYAVKAQSLSALAFIGGRYEVAIALGSRFITTTRRAFCAMNGLPTGLYHISPYVFMDTGTATNVEVVLVTKTSTITEGTTVGLVLPLNGSETYTFANATQTNSINSSWIYEVSSPVNIALGCISGTNLSQSSAFILKIVRIG